MKQLLLILCFIVGGLSFTFSQTLPWLPESPAPDSYGYTWKTNSATDGPSFGWIDITTNGTQVSGLADDNFVGPIPMGIDFPYYWLTKSELWIGSNGFVSFEPANISSTGIGFPPPPTADGNEDLIAPYLTDLSFSGAGNKAQAWTYSDVANNRFIVSFLDVPYWTNNTAGYAGSNSFQVILDANDSTITFQYLSLTGDWNASYNNVTNPFVVGIEAITGNIGLMAVDAPVNTAKKPVDSTSIAFYAPNNPGPVVDAAVARVENKEQAGFFVPWAPPQSTGAPAYRLSASVTNQGSADITSTIFITATATDTTGIQVYVENDSIPGGLLVGESQGFYFSNPFYTPFGGSHSYSIEITNPQDFGDVNSSNDIGTAEAVMMDTTQTEITLSYVSDNINNALTGGGINWTGNTGNSGAAVRFELPAYPAELIAVEFRHLFLQNDTVTQGFSYAIHEIDTTGNSLPGVQLVADTIPFDSLVLNGGWQRVNLETPISIESGGFDVAWYQLDSAMILATETELAGPVSRRSYEILDGDWSVYRSNNNSDIWIRAVVTLDSAEFSTDAEELNLVSKFEVFPNPTTGMINLEVLLDQPSEIMVKIMDMQGRKVWIETRSNSNMLNQQIDLSRLSPGMYMVQLFTPNGQETKRLIKN